MPNAVANRSEAVVSIALLLGVLAHAAATEPRGEWTITPNPVFEGTEFRPALIAAFAPDSAVAISSAPVRLTARLAAFFAPLGLAA